MKPWLAQRAVDRRDVLAFSHTRSGESYTYAEAAKEVQRRAARLGAMGIEGGCRVGVLGENSLDWVFCAHAVFWLGATLVPLNPRASQAELDVQLAEVDLDLVLVDETHKTSKDRSEWVPMSELLAPPVTAPPITGIEAAPADIGLDDVLTVLFTSGTTGIPKAVPLTVDNHLSSASASSSRLGLCEGDHWLCCLPLCHVGGLAIMLRSAIYGTSFELTDAFSATDVLDVLAQTPVTLASFVPTMVHRLLENACGDIASTLRAVLVGGGPIDEALLVEARRRGLPALPTYGMTEASSQLATLSPHDTSLHSTASTALDGVDLRIERVDGSPCDPGESGAIWARGPMITSGYLGRPDINRDRFRDGWFRTGDIGTLDGEGFLHIEHRKGDLIVTGGENVDPREVESVLRSSELVAEVAVVGLDDAQWGQVVAALVVATASDPGRPHPTADVLFEQLERRCRESLAGFKLPRRWKLCDELPRTASGKIRSDRARSLFIERST
jgi:O-succinylbenzoic acid--CoA ligase